MRALKIRGNEATVAELALALDTNEDVVRRLAREAYGRGWVRVYEDRDAVRLVDKSWV